LKHIRQPIQSYRPRALTILLQRDSGRGRVAKEQLYMYNRLASSGATRRDVVQILPAADIMAIGEGLQPHDCTLPNPFCFD